LLFEGENSSAVGFTDEAADEMATGVHEKERALYKQVAQKVETGLPGVEVLALELTGKERFRVYVDHPGGVDHALCAQVTNVLRPYLADYSVEVSSPGLDRPLRTRAHFERAIGRRVRLKTGGRRLRAEVVSAGERAVSVKTAAGEPLEIRYDELVRANLIDEGEQIA
jgi:ribosome maturation factor RimP